MINWIASYPKSGNTWVRMFLSAYFRGHLDINRNTINAHDGAKYLHQSLAPGSLSIEENVFLRPAVLLHLIASRQYTPLIVKSHWANIALHGITAFPAKLTASAVYLMRDPRDVCLSFARHMGKSVDEAIGEMANEQNVVVDEPTGIGSWVTSWSKHVESWAQYPGVTLVKYEDIQVDPEREFTRILEAIKIKYDRYKLQKAIKLCDLERLKLQEQRDGFIECGKQERFFGSGEGWRQELTADQVRRIESDHSDMMARFGYVKAHEPLTLASA